MRCMVLCCPDQDVLSPPCTVFENADFPATLSQITASVTFPNVGVRVLYLLRSVGLRVSPSAGRVLPERHGPLVMNTCSDRLQTGAELVLLSSAFTMIERDLAFLVALAAVLSYRKRLQRLV